MTQLNQQTILETRDHVLSWIKNHKAFYINGEWFAPTAPGTTFFEVIDPATEAVIGNLPCADKKIVDLAVHSARNAFELEAPNGYGQISRKQRTSILRTLAHIIRQNRFELALIETLTNGKTIKESYKDDIPECADVFDYYAGWTDKFYGASVPVDPPFVNYTLNEPLGVVGLIVPWNFPLLLACWKLAPALAMGNTVVIKPASNTSHSLIRFVELIDQAQILPPGTLNLIYGDEEPGACITQHPGVDKISFTGSTSVARKIVTGSAESNLKNITLELGGKSPNIIFADAHPLEQIIERSFTAMFCHKGEKCSEPTRLLIHESLYAKTAEYLVQLAHKVRLGDPCHLNSDQGPQANRKQFQKILDYIEKGQQEGAELLVGGKSSFERGFYIHPTIFGQVTSRMTIAREEIFGPVLCLMSFNTEEEAIAIANDTPYGLAAGFYTQDASRCQRVARKLDAGMVFINHYGCYDFASPFGGFKHSGWGKEMAEDSLLAYTRKKSIWQKY